MTVDVTQTKDIVAAVTISAEVEEVHIIAVAVARVPVSLIGGRNIGAKEGPILNVEEAFTQQAAQRRDRPTMSQLGVEAVMDPDTVLDPTVATRVKENWME